ncbi:hypothetical protein RCSAXON_30 [Rhodobacter phage RcSaxon]|uniref:Uncharacterized protein n=1 Tax=Rhodobacter phage RcSaxon TaxID=1698423 RepID=A0A0K1Y6J5_9CAUD|nr:hypothetical protein RCSAXON_30 [Rhodobacter phage RcSaxon]
MNDSYTKAECGCPGGWRKPSRTENLILNAVGIGGGVAFVALKVWAIAQAFGWL